MNTLQIQKHLKTIHSNLASNVYAANRLPIYVQIPTYIVSNLDIDTKPGSHWVAMHIDSGGVGQYFDSYGRAPTGYHQGFLQRNSRRWDWNTHILQNYYTSVCGEYSLMYLLHKFDGCTMQSFVNLFSGNTLHNDILVDRMFDRYFISNRNM